MRGEGGGRVARRAAAAAACRCSGWISGGAPHADGAASDELGGQSASISRGGGAAGMAIGSGLKGNMAGARRQHGVAVLPLQEEFLVPCYCSWCAEFLL